MYRGYDTLCANAYDFTLQTNHEPMTINTNFFEH